MKRNDKHSLLTPMAMSRRHNQKDAGENGGEIVVEMTCEAPQARKVFVAGDFNRWTAGELRMRQDETGTWKIRLWLAPGRYEYRFIVDGEWQDDPHASIHVPNDFGSSNCVLELTPQEVMSL